MVVGNVVGRAMLGFEGSLEICWTVVGLSVHGCDISSLGDANGISMLVTVGLEGKTGLVGVGEARRRR